MANATLRIWWFTNYRANAGFALSEIGLGLITLPFWAVQGRRPQKAFGFGHAALAVPGTAFPVVPSTYISWGGSQSVAGDTDNYRIQPEVIEIPLADQQTPFGLEAGAIRAWYAQWSQDPSYNLATRNCCDCVVGALTAGGGLHYSQIGTKWLGYDGARTVCSWGKRIRDKVTEMNQGWRQHWETVKPLILQGRAAAGQVDTDDLHAILPARAAATLSAQVRQTDQQKWFTVPTFPIWKKRSSVLVGYRKEQILKMDQLLQEFDGVRNDDPTLRDSNLLGRKLLILKSLLKWAADHLCTKGNSDRRGAVLPLASAAWTEFNRMVAENRCGRNGAPLDLARIE